MKAPVALSLIAVTLLGGVIYFEENRIAGLKKQLAEIEKSLEALEASLQASEQKTATPDK